MAATKQSATKKPAAATSKTRAAKKPAARPRSKAKTASVKNKDVAAYSRAAWDKKPAGGSASKRPEQPMIKTLRAEHRHIATVMQLFLDQLKAIDGGQLVDTHVVYEIMDYMVAWPDQFHHPREDLIYGRAAEIDATVADNVDSLQHDHDQTAKTGRELLKDIERWRQGEISGAVVVNSGRAYIDHMYEHMNSEEKLVFPQIESVLSDQDWWELAQDDELRPVADPVFGRRVQRDFRNLARKLRRNVRRGVERGTLVEWVGIEALMESMEVVSMAYDAARSSAGDHLRSALDESMELFRESIITAPLHCTANNTRLGWRLLADVMQISRDALQDLSRVNQERKDRIRLLD
jgi:hemerythrin-like domain-containing protein